jgi:TorA maturation chaperone TorD
MDQPATKTHDWLALLTGEALLFGLLGKILYSNPEKEWLQTLIDEQVFTESPFASSQPDIIEGLSRLTTWDIDWRAGGKAESLVNLKTDNVRLFSGVGKLPAIPWESVYFSDNRLLFQQRTLDVRSWYRRFGLELVNLYHEPDDHIGLELSFIAHLASLGLQALDEQDIHEFDRVLKGQHDFLSMHLLNWGVLWCNLVIEHSRTNFYSGIALLVKGALKEIACLHNLTISEIGS